MHACRVLQMYLFFLSHHLLSFVIFQLDKTTYFTINETSSPLRRLHRGHGWAEPPSPPAPA